MQDTCNFSVTSFEVCHKKKKKKERKKEDDEKGKENGPTVTLSNSLYARHRVKDIGGYAA